MSRRNLSQNSPFERDVAYSRAVVDGDWIFISGTTGFDYGDMTIADDPAAQTEQCFRNISWALEEAGAGFEDIVRVRYILPDGQDFEPCWPVIRSYLDSVRPAATMMVAGLADPRMKIEIEVTARKRTK